MQSPLHRLYKTKFVLASFVGIVAGYGLMVVGTRIDGLSGYGFLKDVDLHDIGIVLMTSGLIVVLFTYLGNADAEQEAERRTREAVKAEAPAFVAGVIDAIADTPEQILDVTAPEVLDRVIENALTKQLGDRAFAVDIYSNVKAQALRTPERWHDLRISAALSPWATSKDAGSDPMFVATFRYDYRVANPPQAMRFASTSDLHEYRELQADPAMTEVWYFQPRAGLDGSSADAFELVEVTVDGKQRKIRRTAKTGTQLYSTYLATGAHGPAGDVTVSFTYRGLVQQRGHLLYIDLIRPTKGLTVNLAYGEAGIRHVNVADYIAAAVQPVISVLPADGPSPSATLTFDGWVMPKGGVVFGWVLDNEIMVSRTTRPEPSQPQVLRT